MSRPRPVFEITEIECPFCEKDIDVDFVKEDGRCPNCHKRVQQTCVICHKDFFVRESGLTRQVCYNEECLKKFRYHCGKGDRYWRTEAQKKHDKYWRNKK